MAGVLLMDMEVQTTAVGVETAEVNGYALVGKQGRQGAGWSHRGLGVVAAAVALLLGAVLCATGLHADGPNMISGGDGLIDEARAQTTCDAVLKRWSREDWDVAFYHLEFKNGDVEAESRQAHSMSQKKKMFFDPSIDNIVVSSSRKRNACGRGSRSVLWFYPVDDHNGAFDLNDFVCGRLARAYKHSGADCINVYRVNGPREISTILDSYHHDHTVVHAVIGGHGWHSQAVLELGHGKVKKNRINEQMLKKLDSSLRPGATLFLDSCYSGVNGLAKYISTRIPDVWVLGGIVSLDAHMNMLPGKNGPPRVVTNYPSADDKEPTYQAGTQAVNLFKRGKLLGLVSKYGAPAKDPHPH